MDVPSAEAPAFAGMTVVMHSTRRAGEGTDVVGGRVCFEYGDVVLFGREVCEDFGVNCSLFGRVSSVRRRGLGGCR